MSLKEHKAFIRVRAIYNAILWKVQPGLIQLAVPFRTGRVLPNFLIIGAPKSGTTSLFQYLCQHPGFVPPIKKEVTFFSNPDNYQRGEAWYRAHFPRQATMDSVGNRLGYPPTTGEATPAMSINSYAANAHKLVPDAKLIVILRNPVDRAFSQYHHQRRKFRHERLDFWDALQAESERTASDLMLNDTDPERVGRSLRRWGYTHKGRYIDQIEFWLRLYPREQLLILNFADLIVDPVATCTRVVEFIGLPPHPFQINRVFNRGGYHQQMDGNSREYLTEHFRPYNRRLFEFLGEDWGWPS